MGFHGIVKCVAISVAIIILLEGVTIIVAGIYTLATVDFHNLFGKAYRDNIPSPNAFTGSNEADDKTQKINKFVDDQIDKIANIPKHLAIFALILGIFIVLICIFGLVVFYCFDKNWIWLVIFLILIAAVFGVAVYATTYVSTDEKLQKKLFEPIEDVAFSKDASKRYFMGAIQYALSCCGVRGTIDYFCHGTYDYICNPGCLTDYQHWMELVGKPPSAPVCHPSESAEPRPVDAQGSSDCKDYVKQYRTDGTTSSNWLAFSRYDPGQDNPPDERRPQAKAIHGSVFYDNGRESVIMYGERNPIGCGYKAWQSFPFSSIASTAMYTLIFADVLLALEIVLTIISILMIFKEKSKEKRKEEEQSNVNRAKAWASKSETRFFTSS